MPLPATINAASPAGSESPSLGDDQFRALKDALQSILGIPDNTAVSVVYLVGASTGLTAVAFRDSTTNPAMTGYLQRNGVALLFHDGTAARTLVNTATAQTLDAKTLTAVPSITFADAAANPTTARLTQYNATLLGYGDGTRTRFVPGGRTVATLTASSAIANTTTETAFSKAYTAAANVLNVAGTVIDLYAAGVYSTTGTPLLTLKSRIGGLSAGAREATTINNASSLPWSLHSQIVVRTTGAAGTAVPGRWHQAVAGVTSAIDGAAGSTITSITRDLTGALVLDVTAQWGTASASNTITMQSFVVMITYPSETIA